MVKGVISLKYFVNSGTKTWHIVGFCCHSNIPTGKKLFDSEEELYDFCGRKAVPCLLCQKTKEKRLARGE